MGLARVQARGQVTIPATIRKACGLKPGDALLIRTKGSGLFEAQVVSHHDSVTSLIERYQVPGKAKMDSLRAEMGEEMTRARLAGAGSKRVRKGGRQP